MRPRASRRRRCEPRRHYSRNLLGFQSTEKNALRVLLVLLLLPLSRCSGRPLYLLVGVDGINAAEKNKDNERRKSTSNRSLSFSLATQRRDGLLKFIARRPSVAW